LGNRSQRAGIRSDKDGREVTANENPEFGDFAKYPAPRATTAANLLNAALVSDSANPAYVINECNVGYR
jgi:hypothetical protein